MLHHVSVGVRDIERAAAFYDAVLGTLGYTRMMEILPHAIGYGAGHPDFWIQLPHNQQVATAGNGVHVSFIAASPEDVQAFYEAAIAQGAEPAGEPGPRSDYTPDYFSAFVFDLDGNKLEATYLPLPGEEDAIEVAFADEVDDEPVRKPKKAKKPAKKAVKPAAKPAAKKPAAKKAAKKAVKKAAPKPATKKTIKVVVKPVKVDKKAKADKKPKKDKKADKKDKKAKKGKKK